MRMVRTESEDLLFNFVANGCGFHRKMSENIAKSNLPIRTEDKRGY